MNSPFRLNLQPTTIRVLCEQCGDWFQEIDHVVVSKEANPDVPLLCIKCDPWSLKVAITRVTLKGLESLT